MVFRMNYCMWRFTQACRPCSNFDEEMEVMSTVRNSSNTLKTRNENFEFTDKLEEENFDIFPRLREYEETHNLIPFVVAWRLIQKALGSPHGEILIQHVNTQEKLETTLQAKGIMNLQDMVNTAALINFLTELQDSYMKKRK